MAQTLNLKFHLNIPETTSGGEKYRNYIKTELFPDLSGGATGCTVRRPAASNTKKKKNVKGEINVKGEVFLQNTRFTGLKLQV